MAITLESSYSGGADLERMIAPTVFGMDTVNRKGAYVIDGIKKTLTLETYTSTDPLKPRVATPTSADSTTNTVGAITITPKEFMTYAEFDPQAFETHFSSELLQNRIIGREIPFNQWILNYHLQLVKKQMERGVHIGSTTYTAAAGTAGNGQVKFFDGFLKRALGGGSGVLQVASPSAITSGNILAKMDAAIGTMVVDVLNNYENLVFSMGIADWQLYESATTALGWKGNDVSKSAVRTYRGYQIKVLGGIPKNTFYFGVAQGSMNDNLIIGLNAIEDTDYLQFDRKQANSDLWFIKGIFKMDTAIQNPTELVVHTTAVLGDFSV